MFPRRERLSREYISAALPAGRRVSSKHFTAVLPKEGRGFAVIVPKKVARLSVTRHLIKRRVLAALKSLPHPTSLIIFPKASVKDIQYKDIKEELGTLLSKINQ
ncbi:MAG: ribonuclease P protein component [bacterium]|nr:ribonuclease P protein component [bacterium]MDO8742281.1 ribonuclease P protein component [bacterium]